MVNKDIRNLCRICMAQGANHSLFAEPECNNNADPLTGQFDRLDQKLRFLGMIPINESSSIMPNKLCYTCVVQLNLAYNLKNVIINTNMYLERYTIENGLLLNGRPSAIEQLAILPPPPPLSSCPSSLNPTNVGSPTSIVACSDVTGTLDSMMDCQEIIPESLIKVEVLGDEDEANRPESEVQPEPETPNQTKKRNRKPMVKLHDSIENNSHYNREYIKSFLNSNKRANSTINESSYSEKNRKRVLTSFELSLTQDIMRSESLRKIFKTLPTKRLRERKPLKNSEQEQKKPKKS